MSTAGHNLHPTATTTAALTPRPKVSRWAYVLIVVGALSLFDLIGLDNWGTPLIMIVAGVALLTRPYAWGRTLALVLMVAVVVAVAGWSFTHPPGSQSLDNQSLDNQSLDNQSLDNQTIAQPLTSARAEIHLSTTIGRLNVSVSSSGNLIDGTFDLNRNDRLDRTFSTRGDTQVVSLAVRQTNPGIALPWSTGNVDAHWSIGLSPRVPLALRVDPGP